MNGGFGNRHVVLCGVKCELAYEGFARLDLADPVD